MAAFLDACRFTPTLGGTTDWTYSSAVTGYNSPALAGVVNSRVYKYRAESTDLSQWEIGEGAYNTGTGVLARTTVLSNSSGTGTATGQSGAGTKINFSTVPQVAIVAIKEDLLSIEEANSFTAAQKAQATDNIAAFGRVKKTVITSSGTFTRDTKCLYAILEAVGSGGSGGGATGSAGGVFTGGGGGSGGWSRTYVSAATLGATQTVTIAAGVAGTAGAAGTGGGTTSIGTLCVANGGGAGQLSSSVTAPAGAPGGSAGTGDLAATGAPGTGGLYSAGSLANLSCSGIGGSTPYGGGGTGNSGGGSSNGTNATGYGGGGGGAVATNTGASLTGGSSFQGVAIITEFCSS
jgi:hypothetical protein